MSILDRVREQKQRTEEQLSRGGGSVVGAKWWRPGTGSNTIRILPPWSDDSKYQDMFWREIHQHWGVSEDQRGPVMCPKLTPDLEGECPICELIAELRADKANPAAQQRARDIRAKKAFLLNIVDLKDPTYTASDVAEWRKSSPDKECPFEAGDDKVQVYACPLSIFDQILGIMDSSGLDITDLEDGRNITIKKTPHKDPMKTRYEVYPDLEAKPSVAQSPSLVALDKVGYQMDYNQMLQLLDGEDASSSLALAGGSSTKSLPSSKDEDDSYLNKNDSPAKKVDEDDVGAAMRAALSKSKKR